jgi:alkylhydroperoxidase/carboxymuconolactone decarboxylase family protein YurZ
MMENLYPPFVNELKKHDAEFYKNIAQLYDTALAPGALEAKTKMLIILALDAYAGLAQGVKSVAEQARSMGITDEEMKEALRLAYLVAGNPVLSLSNTIYKK